MPEISRASHKYTALAREGKGCVELSLWLDKNECLLELPSRPEYYSTSWVVVHCLPKDIYTWHSRRQLSLFIRFRMFILAREKP
jgi:hypothetical protein